MTKTPSSHIVHKTSPITDGSLLLTESAKSLIGVTMPKVSSFAVVVATVSASDNKPLSNLPNQETSHENPIGQNGRKGTVSSPKNKNHRLNCIRLDKQFLSARFAMKRMPVMAQRSRLLRKNGFQILPYANPFRCFYRLKAACAKCLALPWKACRP